MYLHVQMFQLDFDALGRLGVENPRDYAKKRFGSDVLVLSGCIVGPSFISQVEAGLDEVIVNQQWMDILVSHFKIP